MPNNYLYIHLLLPFWMLNLLFHSCYTHFHLHDTDNQTLNSIEVALKYIYSHNDMKSYRSKNTFIQSRLRLELHGDGFHYLTAYCRFCKWKNALPRFDIPLDWKPRKLSKYNISVIESEDICTNTFILHTFSQLFPTDIENHYAIQCNTYMSDKQYLRLLLLRKKGSRFVHVTDIYNIETHVEGKD